MVLVRMGDREREIADRDTKTEREKIERYSKRSRIEEKEIAILHV